jgi:hypothetical protein
MSLINDKWEILFDKYNIDQRVKSDGLFYITADQIREVKEPRLMTKFDTKESLPTVFHKRLAILPVTRGTYVIGEFCLYEDFPDTKPDITQMTAAKIPDYFETIDINDIRSEAGAINVMGITGILDNFLGEANMVQTVSGRMGSGSFDFTVNGLNKNCHNIHVQNSQIEIDGGFENQNVFILVEGKNVVHSNFLIRQLYYPFRTWHEKIVKPIRPVFMIYSNNIFRLLEYEFTVSHNYSSIRLIQEQNYSLEDIDISLEDLNMVYQATTIKPEPKVTFVQADSFYKVISLVENIADSPMTAPEIADLFGFDERQSDYYFNACKYLGLAEKNRTEDGIKVCITPLGKRLLKLKYKARQLEYARLILEHQIFNEMFGVLLNSGQLPDKNLLKHRMKELGVCSDSLISRRASSVRGWLLWLLHLAG